MAIGLAQDAERRPPMVPEHASSGPGRPASGVLEGLQVLVVDDDESQARALAALLRDDGISATSMSDPEQALARFGSHPLDAVIVDVGMPRLDGPGLLAGLRVHHPHLPAVLLTGHEQYDARVMRAMASGDVAYVAKPVDVDALLATLAGLIELARMA